MTLKGRTLIACAAVTLTLGIAGAPAAFAQGQTAHNLSKTMRHRPMMMHRPMMHHHMMMRHHRRMMRHHPMMMRKGM